MNNLFEKPKLLSKLACISPQIFTQTKFKIMQFAFHLLLLLTCLNCTIQAQQHQPNNPQLKTLFNSFSEHFPKDPKKSKAIVLEMISVAKKLRDTTELAIAYSNLGACEQLQSDFKAAEKAYNQFKALEQSAKIDSNSLGKIYNDIGALYLRFNDNVQGLENLLQAYKIRSTIKDKNIGSTLNNIAYVYTRLNDYKTATKYLNESLNLRRAQKDTTGTMSVLNNLGGIYGYQGNYEDALKSFEEVLALAKKLDNQHMIGYSYGNIGDVYINQEKYEAAIQYLEKQLAINQELGEKDMQCNALINLGESHTKLKQFPIAQSYYQQALVLSQSLGTMDNVIKAYQHLAILFEKKGDYKAALENTKRYRALSDSISLAESKSKIDELRVQFDSYKTEQDNVLLQKENELQDAQIARYNTQRFFWGSLALMLFILVILFIVLYQYRTRTNKELRHINSSKDRLFALVAHDLKNPLSAFKSITQSLHENARNIDKEEIEYYLKRLYNASDKLYLLLQNLLEWALNENGKLPFHPSPIQAKDSIEEVDQLLLLSAAEKKISLLNEIPEGLELFTDDKMFKTVVRNLVSNAIKFSPKGEKIRIWSTIEPNFVVIHVKDSGIGISPEDQKKLFLATQDSSTIGNSKEKGTGLGLLLCKELVERQGGQLWVESSLKKGSTFSFSIPKN